MNVFKRKNSIIIIKAGLILFHLKFGKITNFCMLKFFQIMEFYLFYRVNLKMRHVNNDFNNTKSLHRCLQKKVSNLEGEISFAVSKAAFFAHVVQTKQMVQLWRIFFCEVLAGWLMLCYFLFEVFQLYILIFFSWENRN